MTKASSVVASVTQQSRQRVPQCCRCPSVSPSVCFCCHFNCIHQVALL